MHMAISSGFSILFINVQKVLLDTCPPKAMTLNFAIWPKFVWHKATLCQLTILLPKTKYALNLVLGGSYGFRNGIKVDNPCVYNV